MHVKEIWSDKDFDEMGWHDSCLHAISFPQYDQVFELDIDYIFEWVLNKESNLFNFHISPCTLTFYDVLNLEINISFDDSIGISIADITRENPRKLANDKLAIWDYVIETDKGTISFTATGFEQKVLSQPILSESISLDRKP